MDEEVIEFLNEKQGYSEAARVSTYRVFVGPMEATVVVNDHGPAAGSHRYSVEAYPSDLSEDERMGGGRGWSLGNPEPDLNMALHNVHWWELEAAMKSED